MSKFGDLIDIKIPVLLDFYTERDACAKSMHLTLKNVAASLEGKVRIIKIDIDKNQLLREALSIKNVPTLMLYKHGVMKWRQSGAQDGNTLIKIIKEYF